MNLEEKLIELAKEEDSLQLDKISSTEWLLKTSGDLLVKFEEIDRHIVISCVIDENPIAEKFYKMMLMYNSLHLETGGVFMGLTDQYQPVMQVSLFEESFIIEEGLNFISVLENWKKEFTSLKNTDSYYGGVKV